MRPTRVCRTGLAGPVAGMARAGSIRAGRRLNRRWRRGYDAARRGCSSMAEQKLPKLTTRVRFPSPAPTNPPFPRSDSRFFGAILCNRLLRPHEKQACKSLVPTNFVCRSAAMVSIRTRHLKRSARPMTGGALWKGRSRVTNSSISTSRAPRHLPKLALGPNPMAAGSAGRRKCGG